MPYISEEDLMRLASVQQMQGVSGGGIPVPQRKPQQAEAPPDTTWVDTVSSVAGATAGVGTALVPGVGPLLAPLAGAAGSEGLRAGGRAVVGAEQEPAQAVASIGAGAARSGGVLGQQQAELRVLEERKEAQRKALEELKVDIESQHRAAAIGQRPGGKVSMGITSRLKASPKSASEPYAWRPMVVEAQAPGGDPASVVAGLTDALGAGEIPPERIGEVMGILDELRRKYGGMV